MDSMNNIVPVVVLDRIPSLENLGNRTVFNVSEFEHIGLSKESSSSKSQRSTRSTNDLLLNLKGMRLDNPETSDSDDDLPDLGLSVAVPKAASRANSTADYKSSFDEIMSSQLKINKALKAFEQNRNDIDTMVNNPADQEQSLVLKSELDIDEGIWLKLRFNDKLMLPTEIQIDVHPGENILDPSLKGKVFPKQQLTFENIENPITSVDAIFQKLSCDLLGEIIKSRMFISYYPRLTDKPAAIRLLFRLISTHEDRSFVVKCKDLLLSLLKGNPTEASTIGFKEILEVLVNSGTTLNKLIPVPELLAIVEQNVETRTLDVQNSQSQSAELQEHCLECILQVLRFLFRNRGSKTLFLVHHLPVLVVTFSTLAIDKSLRTSVVPIKILEIIDELLLQFPVDVWADCAINLAKYLSAVSDIPQNMANIAQMFCYSDRGNHLQRLTSFTMCHKLLGMEPPKSIPDVMPQAVLLLIKSAPKRCFEDLCIMYNVIVLVNLSVGQNVLRDDLKVIQELAAVMKKMANCIKNNQNAMDGIKIRNLATTIYTKWTIMANIQPVFQKSLFDDADSSDP